MSDRCVEFREMSPAGREMVTSGGEREKHRAWTHDMTPSLRNGFQTFPSAQQGERQSGSGVGRGMGGQAHLEEEGLETVVDTGAKVVPVEQEDREQTTPLAHEPCVQTLWAPGPERALERTLWAPGPERGLEWTLWAPGPERGLERTLWAHGTERTLERTL